jgi:hypothetical protein
MVKRMIKTNNSAPRIAVIGAGMAGLECVLQAANRGCHVEIFEVGPRTRAHHVNWDTSIHPGDEKSRSWICEGWGPGGGLSERFGGRTLCYHGVLLELEPDELADWGPVWQRRLGAEGGLYASVLSRLRRDYANLHSDGFNGNVNGYGLHKVPQAARVDAAGRFEAYSPIASINAMIESGQVVLRRGRVLAVSPGTDKSWDVQMSQNGENEHVVCSGFDACILAASAIGNIQILARSLARNIKTTITDHFCAGAFLRLPAGSGLAPFRHSMLWSGFANMPELNANIFFLECPPLPNGDRLVELYAVAEQQGGTNAYSELCVDLVGKDSLRTHIRAKISERDEARLNEVHRKTSDWAALLAGSSLEELRSRHGTAAEARSDKHNGSDIRWFKHDAAQIAVRQSDRCNVYSRFELPYGAFEHEACTHPIGDKGPIPISTDLEVLELPRVYVAGPGLFPRLGAANPALNIIATSHWLGNYVAEDLGA